MTKLQGKIGGVDVERMTTKEMIIAQLKAMGADGLCGEDCGCRLDDFMPCDGNLMECVAAKSMKATHDFNGDKVDFIMIPMDTREPAVKADPAKATGNLCSQCSKEKCRLSEYDRRLGNITGCEKSYTPAKATGERAPTGICQQCGKPVSLGKDGSCNNGHELCFDCWEKAGHNCPVCLGTPKPPVAQAGKDEGHTSCDAVSDFQVIAWGNRNDVRETLTQLRAMVEDARTLTPQPPKGEDAKPLRLMELQARSFCDVYCICADLGMKHIEGNIDLTDVIAFIRHLSEKEDVSTSGLYKRWANQWGEVFSLCNKLRMPHECARGPIQDVLAFIRDLHARAGEAVRLLDLAQCPNCDGCGFTVREMGGVDMDGDHQPECPCASKQPAPLFSGAWTCPTCKTSVPMCDMVCYSCGTPRDEQIEQSAPVDGQDVYSPRFVVVSDLPEWTVWDQKRQCDLFPTKSGNRDKSCGRCYEETAHMIADALNSKATAQDVMGVLTRLIETEQDDVANGYLVDAYDSWQCYQNVKRTQEQREFDDDEA